MRGTPTARAAKPAASPTPSCQPCTTRGRWAANSPANRSTSATKSFGAQVSASAMREVIDAPPTLLELRYRRGLGHGVARRCGTPGQLGKEEVELGALAEPQADESDRAPDPLRQPREQVDELAFSAAPHQRRIDVQDRPVRERLGIEQRSSRRRKGVDLVRPACPWPRRCGSASARPVPSRGAAARDQPAQPWPQADQGLCERSQADLRPGSKRVHPTFIETAGVARKASAGSARAWQIG